MIASIRETQKKYCSRAMVTAILAGLAFIMAGQKGIGKGLVLGTLFSVLNFILMGEMLPFKVNESRTRASALSLAFIFFRYGLMAIPLILALKLEQFNLPAVVVGIFLVQIMILGEYVVNFILPGRRNQL